MAAKVSVLGQILSSYPYLRSAMVWFPLKMLNILKFNTTSLNIGLRNLARSLQSNPF